VIDCLHPHLELDSTAFGGPSRQLRTRGGRTVGRVEVGLRQWRPRTTVLVLPATRSARADQVQIVWVANTLGCRRSVEEARRVVQNRFGIPGHPTKRRKTRRHRPGPSGPARSGHPTRGVGSGASGIGRGGAVEAALSVRRRRGAISISKAGARTPGVAIWSHPRPTASSGAHTP
jgi:hypothetical protein